MKTAAGPTLVAHADWSVDARKRWVAVAVRARNEWHLTAPEPVGDPANLLQRLRERAGGGPTVAGFDFPIGLPAAYANRVGVRDFRAFLDALGRPPWERFFDVAERPADIALHRPFYPFRPGGARRAHLLSALGADDTDGLRRRCERPTARRSAAECLFWTLGGKQVGKAALAGWREVLIPARWTRSAALWPFDGRLADLLQRPGDVVLETYPAGFYHHLGVRFGGPGNGKRAQAARRANAGPLLDFGRRASDRGRPVHVDDVFVESISDGFGNRHDGEDRFDAAVGLFGMLNLILGLEPFHEPTDPVVRAVEGWIFGQGAPEVTA